MRQSINTTFASLGRKGGLKTSKVTGRQSPAVSPVMIELYKSVNKWKRDVEQRLSEEELTSFPGSQTQVSRRHSRPSILNFPRTFSRTKSFPKTCHSPPNVVYKAECFSIYKAQCFSIDPSLDAENTALIINISLNNCGKNCYEVFYISRIRTLVIRRLRIHEMAKFGYATRQVKMVGDVPGVVEESLLRSWVEAFIFFML